MLNIECFRKGKNVLGGTPETWGNRNRFSPPTPTLRQLVRGQITLKHSEVLAPGRALHIRCHGIVAHERTASNQFPPSVTSHDDHSLVFSHIVVCPVDLVDIISLKPRIRHILLIHTPAHSLSFQQICDSLGGAANAPIVVSYDPVSLTADGSDIIWLRWMRDCLVVAEGNALARDPLE